MLLAEGRHDELLARHYEALRDRARLRVGAADADDVLQAALERLVRELRRGCRYPVPFRVAAHQILGWAIDARRARPDRHADGRVDADPADPVDHYAGVDMRLTVEAIIATLPAGDRAAVRLRFVEGCEIAEIARRLGRTRNAVDQALFRGRRHLREGLGHGDR